MIAAERVGRKPRPGVLRRVVEIGRFRDERSRDRATPPSHSDAANAKQTRSLIAINPTSGAAAGHTSSEMSPRARMSLPVSADFSPSLDTNAPLDRADRRPTSRRSTRPRRRVPARQQRQGLRSTCCPDLLVANSRSRSTGRSCRSSFVTMLQKFALATSPLAFLSSGSSVAVWSALFRSSGERGGRIACARRDKAPFGRRSRSRRARLGGT